MPQPSAALVESVYDAIADEEVYDHLAGWIAREAGAASGWFQERHGDSLTLRSPFNFNDDIAKPYAEHFWRVDPWVKAVRSCASGAPMMCERYVSQAEYERSEMWNDLAGANGGIFHCCGVVVDVPGGKTFVALQRLRGQAAFDEETEAFLGALAPHLVRLAKTRWRLALKSARLKAPVEALEAVCDGLFLVSADGRVAWANAAGRAIIAEGQRLRQGPDGTLMPTSRPEAVRFAAAVRRAAGPRGGSDRWIWGGGDDAWSVAIDPVALSIERQPLAWVSVRDVAAHARRAACAAAETHGLTVAETELTAALARGATPETYAGQRSVRISTVRSQLHAIFAKTGAATQAALVALVLQAPGL